MFFICWDASEKLKIFTFADIFWDKKSWAKYFVAAMAVEMAVDNFESSEPKFFMKQPFSTKNQLTKNPGQCSQKERAKQWPVC